MFTKVHIKTRKMIQQSYIYIYMCIYIYTHRYAIVSCLRLEHENKAMLSKLTSMFFFPFFLFSFLFGSRENKVTYLIKGLFSLKREREKRTTQNTKEDLKVRPFVKDKRKMGFDPVPPCLTHSFL